MTADRDIVERLRSKHDDTWPKNIGYGDLINEDGPDAADEIERLRSLLREAGEAMLKMHVAIDQGDPWGKENVNRFNSAVRENFAVLSKIKGLP